MGRPSDSSSAPSSGLARELAAQMSHRRAAWVPTPSHFRPARRPIDSIVQRPAARPAIITADYYYYYYYYRSLVVVVVVVAAAAAIGHSPANTNQLELGPDVAGRRRRK